MRPSSATITKSLSSASRPSPACACGRLRRATRALTQLYDDLLAPAGLRVTQFSLLRTLAREGPMRISELAAAQLLDRTALSRNLDPLVELGHVEIVRGQDARSRDVARRVGADKLDVLIDILRELESLHPDLAPTTSPRRSPTAGSTDRRPA